MQTKPDIDLRGVKVLLINMPMREQVLPGNPPIGLGMLSAVLRQHGALPVILDMNGYRVRENGSLHFFREVDIKASIQKQVEKHGDFYLVGLSGLITTLRWQKTVARIVREMQPQALLVSGGGLATAFRKILFAWIPELDGIATGEGEGVIAQIAADAKKFFEVGRAAYGGVTQDRSRFFYEGQPVLLDELPMPDYSSLPVELVQQYLSTPVWGHDAKNSSSMPFQMHRSWSMIASRGCPFACNFCCREAQGGRDYRYLSVERLRNEMTKYHDEYNADFIGIVDDNFMVDRKRLVKLPDILNGLCKSGLRWGTHGRLDEAADERKPFNVNLMSQAGCVYIGFGAESADSTVLERMGKGGQILSRGFTKHDGFSFPTAMVDGILKTLNAGIYGNCTWIMGYPGETLQALKTSVAFILWQESLHSNWPFNRSFFCATAYPGTALFREPKVKEKLAQVFGLEFDSLGHPAPTQAFQSYVEQLEDATKLIQTERGILNYSEMPDETFLQMKEYIAQGQLEKVMEM